MGGGAVRAATNWLQESPSLVATYCAAALIGAKRLFMLIPDHIKMDRALGWGVLSQAQTSDASLLKQIRPSINEDDRVEKGFLGKDRGEG